MPGILDTIAVSTQSGDNAQQIVAAYIQTGPQMVLNHTPDVAPQMSLAAQPKGTTPGGSIDPFK